MPSSIQGWICSDGVKDIEEAFERLNEAFGNPAKVMGFNLKALEDLGTMPSEKLANGQLSYSKRIEWLLKLEVILAKILDLSKRSSKLAHEAFSSSTYRKLWARFPTHVLNKLVKIQGEDEERFEAILAKLKEMRQHAQMMDDECGVTNASKKKSDGGVPIKATADIYFKSPQRFDECRVCVHLSATNSSHQNLFENHLSNYATGCPKFIEATMELRRSLVDKIKLCRQCFHPDIIMAPGHLKDCPFSNPQKKNAYTCSSNGCKTHMWICLTHKQKNKELMEKFKNNLERKGLHLGCTTLDTKQAFQQNSASFSSAVRKMKRTEKQKDSIVPVPDGEPLFLFFGAKGKKRVINTFFDSGCSHAVFKKGIPGTELKGQLISKGPFHIGGVGGLTTTSDEEWVVFMNRTDGKKQLVQGLTVPQITCDFPALALKTAEEALKSDDPSNQALQKCKIPPMAGGTVDVLLGIKYNSWWFISAPHTLCGWVKQVQTVGPI